MQVPPAIPPGPRSGSQKIHENPSETVKSSNDDEPCSCASFWSRQGVLKIADSESTRLTVESELHSLCCESVNVVTSFKSQFLFSPKSSSRERSWSRNPGLGSISGLFSLVEKSPSRPRFSNYPDQPSGLDREESLQLYGGMMESSQSWYHQTSACIESQHKLH